MKATSRSTRPLDVALRLPTSAVCFNSLHTGRTFVVFANKGGCVNVVDVELRRLLVSLQTNETIRELEVFSAPDSLDLWLLVTHSSGQQSLMRIESEEMPLRENMAHTIPDDILHVTRRITGINADTTLTSYSAEKNTLSVLDGVAERTEIAQFPVPVGCSRTFFASRLLACATEDSSVQTCLPFIKSDRFQPTACKCRWMTDGPSKVLGFVPVARTFDLDQCLAVCTSGLFMLTPTTPLSVLTINQLIQTNFSAPPFLDICECTKKEPFAFFEAIFREVVRSKAANCVELIDGLVSLAFELGFELRKLSALTNELGQHDALIPYLSVRCEKEQQDSGVRQLLFETFTHKLWKLDPHSAQKEQLEREICQFLIKYESRPEVIDVLLKHSLLSCSIRNRAAVTPQVAAFLVEHPKWSSFDAMDVLRLVGGLQWSLLEATTKKLLYRKLMHFAGSEIHRPPHQWAALMSVAARELRAEHTAAAPFFVFVCLGWNPLGFGSNCAVVIGDDRRLWAG
ncbi:hypothetical protein M3Y99_01456600 [Aphelenchoides fujianensis]|nr:hypothetical protein M3Y99_01456600 [Aphelenchoides fujianensis]